MAKVDAEQIDRTPVTMYRYRVVETWGVLASSAPIGRHLLEHQWIGKEHQWNVWSDTEGRIVGGAVGVYVDKVKMCPCARFLTDVEHGCPWQQPITLARPETPVANTDQGQ